MKNNVLIIGGSWFVGPYLIDLLTKDDPKITLFSSGNFSIDYPNALANQMYADILYNEITSNQEYGFFNKK